MLTATLNRSISITGAHATALKFKVDLRPDIPVIDFDLCVTNAGFVSLGSKLAREFYRSWISRVVLNYLQLSNKHGLHARFEHFMLTDFDAVLDPIVGKQGD